MSITAGTPYEIGRRTNVCAATGRALVAGERYVAVLIEREDGQGLDRADYSEAGWAGLSPRPRGLFAHWRGVVDAPGAKGPRLIDDGALMDLFEQLGETDDPRRVAFRYVLALLLVRKRLLETVSQRAGVLMVRRRGEEGPAAAVRAPELDARAIADATEQLQALLRAEG
ncbi:MAG: hypothetical protein IBJ11_06670 [Phycisphaerales bacterium]|nr:hypothetical protein [Phycisphaerales bacterium]